MATLGGGRGERLNNSNFQKPSFTSPEKVRELLSDGVSSPDIGSSRCVFPQLSKLLLAGVVSHLACELCCLQSACCAGTQVSSYVRSMQARSSPFYAIVNFCIYLVHFPVGFVIGLGLLSLPCTTPDKGGGDPKFPLLLECCPAAAQLCRPR